MVSNVEQITPFPSLIYKTRFNGDLSGIANLALKICNTEGTDYLLEVGGKSTYDTVKDAILKPECFELHDFIIAQHKTVWDMWHLTNRPRYVHSSWFNLHPPGSFTEEHDHSGIHMVVVAYLKNPENGGNIQFKDPMNQIWASYPRTDDYAYDWKTVEVKTGDVLFFPGFLRHKTEINKSDEDRLVLTTNVCIDFFG
jgi:uncharacterized protein (TIGR02466 family)